MKKLTGIFLAALVLTACSDPRAAQKALDDIGFTDIRTTGWRWLSCGDDYSFSTGFEAKNPKGKPISGTVCSGWFKGSSVKFD